MSRDALLVFGICRACPCKLAPETDELPVCHVPVPTCKRNLTDDGDEQMDTLSNWIATHSSTSFCRLTKRNLATKPHANGERSNTHEQNSHALNTNLPRTMLHHTETELPIANHDSTMNQPQKTSDQPTVIYEPIKTTSTPRSTQAPNARAPLIETFTNQPITGRCLQMDQP